MALTQTQVVALYTEFDAVSNVDDWLTLAAERLTASAWGNVYNQAVAYLAMHLMLEGGLGTGATGAVGPGAGAAGVVTAEKVGDVSKSYGAASTDASSIGDADLMSTKFGRLYISLRESRAAAAPMLIQPSAS